VFVSSRSDDADKIMGIAQGGDDYIEKPFHLELLRAKVDAVLRRVKDKICVLKDLYYDVDSQTLLFQSEKIELTKMENRILVKLLEEKSKVVTREELMMELWSTDEYVSDGTLTTIVSRLRAKLKANCNDDVIHTKKGVGYFIE